MTRADRAAARVCAAEYIDALLTEMPPSKAPVSFTTKPERKNRGVPCV
jgi:hypothetical protein